ncbi:MAG: sn-glycerol-1-phosphate dehydrogenase [Oscillospiraceae bacterium]|nr:sn-glycerol-1-phosphate dehydrogenase [Oscillospiraceae bacterium]
MSMEQLNAMNGRLCSCGKIHSFDAKIVTGSGVIKKIPEFVAEFGGKKVFVLSDKNTFAAAGERVCGILADSGISYVTYSFPEKALEPDERSVGSAVMHYDASCDLVIAVGSGVINDIGKILSAVSQKPYIIVGTAPSMDGYASATSSMTRDSLKISLPSRGADVIIGDTDILRNAPLKMMKAGLGDMLAKYVSICEWRIAKIIAGEYYCEEIADLIRGAVERCVDNAEGLLRREEAAVQAVFEGLVIGGVAMNYAGLSRPASGVEHYISHVLDMRGAEFGTTVELHGIQCAVGTRIAVGLYEKLKAVMPDREKALVSVRKFDYDRWSAELRHLLGKGAESMIALEAKEGKYDPEAHKKRLELILQNWDALLKIMDEELPAFAQLEGLLDRMEMPKTLGEIGTADEMLDVIFRATKDIRDKYVLSRLAWDLGILDELLQS